MCNTTSPTRKSLDASEVKSLIDHVGPHINGNCDFTYEPQFPEGRQDVCAVRRMAENGTSYGFDTIYLVWRGDDGELHHKELCNSQATKDYIHINKVAADDDNITVEFGSGGSYSGTPWSDLSTTKV